MVGSRERAPGDRCFIAHASAAALSICDDQARQLIGQDYKGTIICCKLLADTYSLDRTLPGGTCRKNPIRLITASDPLTTGLVLISADHPAADE